MISKNNKFRMLVFKAQRKLLYSNYKNIQNYEQSSIRKVAVAECKRAIYNIQGRYGEQVWLL